MILPVSSHHIARAPYKIKQMRDRSADYGGPLVPLKKKKLIRYNELLIRYNELDWGG